MRLLSFIIFSFFVKTVFGQENDALSNVRQLMDEEKCSEALLALNKFIATDSLNPNVFIMRAKCFRKIGDYKKAHRDLSYSIKLNKMNADAYCELGTIYSIEKSFNLAMSNFNKAISIDSTHQNSYCNRGILYGFYLEKYINGIMDLDKAIILKPTDQFSYYNRGLLFNKIKMFQRAVEDLTISLKLHPDDHLTYHERGLSNLWLREYEKAASDFLSAIKFNNREDPFERLSNKYLYEQVAICYKKMGKRDEAEEFLIKAKQSKN